MNKEIDYSFIYLISKNWLDLYYNYLETRARKDFLTFNNENYKELNYFNQDVMEKEIFAEKFYRYHDDFRGLNSILKENLAENDFQILDLNTLNFIKTRFKGNIIKREVRRNPQEKIIEFIPIRVIDIKTIKKFFFFLNFDKNYF